jgi:hypothetical protein
MRQRITPDLVRIGILAATVAYIAGLWCWMRLDALLHPDEEQ